jgi:hypothetical protein
MDFFNSEGQEIKTVEYKRQRDWVLIHVLKAIYLKYYILVTKTKNRSWVVRTCPEGIIKILRSKRL